MKKSERKSADKRDEGGPRASNSKPNKGGKPPGRNSNSKSPQKPTTQTKIFKKKKHLFKKKWKHWKYFYGILKLTSRVKQGSNKRGVPIYLFRPYHHKYPNFLVCSNKKPRKNIFCSISFNKWDNIRKVHFGKMERIIGETGNYDNEIQYMMMNNQYHYY